MSLHDFLERIDLALASRSSAVVLVAAVERLDFVDWHLGFDASRDVLAEVVERLDGLWPEQVLYPLPGRKIGLLLDSVAPADALNAAQRLVALWSAPFSVGSVGVFAPPVIGLAPLRQDHANGAQALREALFALEDARNHPLGNARLYDPECQHLAEWSFGLENDMRAGFETGDQFHVVYQPLVSLDRTHGVHVEGFEALLRWTHPEWGPIPPDQFIPVAEKCALILGLGNYVLWEACRQQVRWHADTGRQVLMAVNLSPVQLMTEGIEETIADAIAETGIDPHYLKLEITETALALAPRAMVDKLARLRTMGVAIGIDDFGAGYSSLGQLDIFGLDFMKVDKSLIQRMNASSRQTELIRLSIALAKNLGMVVVAEGVETTQQLETLFELGADYGQGFLFDRPQPPDQAVQWLVGATWSAETP